MACAPQKMWCSVWDLVKRMHREQRDSPRTIRRHLLRVACLTTCLETIMDYRQSIIRISTRGPLPHMRMEEE